MYASLLSALERHPEAIQEIRRAQQLDPLSLLINAEAAWDLYMARDFQGAMEQAWRTLAMEPRFAPAQHALGLAYQQMGMLEEAIVEFQNARVCSANHPAAAAALGYAYAIAGQRMRPRNCCTSWNGGPKSARLGLLGGAAARGSGRAWQRYEMPRASSRRSRCLAGMVGGRATIRFASVGGVARRFAGEYSQGQEQFVPSLTRGATVT